MWLSSAINVYLKVLHKVQHSFLSILHHMELYHSTDSVQSNVECWSLTNIAQFLQPLLSGNLGKSQLVRLIPISINVKAYSKKSVELNRTKFDRWHFARLNHLNIKAKKYKATLSGCHASCVTFVQMTESNFQTCQYAFCCIYWSQLYSPSMRV